MELYFNEAGRLYRVRAFQEENPLSPRDGENFGVMVCSHPRYDLGDIQVRGFYEFFADETGGDLTWYEKRGKLSRLFKRWWMTKEAFLPLSLHDHSALSMSSIFPGGYDASLAGFIYVDKDSPKVREYRSSHTGRQTRRWARARLEKEVEEYSLYLEGNVFRLVKEAYDPGTSSFSTEEVFENAYLEDASSFEKEALSLFSCASPLDEEDVERSLLEKTLDTLLTGQGTLDFQR
jgi:hypothetical protein